jgi:phosphonate degradation associated HDIG domain protein
MTPHQIVQMIFDVYNKVGHRQYGESVTELQHALQTATFAMHFNSSDAIVVASLLHDYGHLQHDEGEDVASHGVDMRHEDLGVVKLKSFFGPEILEPIRLHVAAKRYLCHKSKAYIDGLSRASRLSLQIQGGPMSADESTEFESNPFYKSAVELRRFDDMGKVSGMKTPTLDSFFSLVLSFVR